MTTPRPVRRLTVDGELFDVRPSRHQPGHDLDWVSGPNPDYGFSTGVTASATRGDPADEPAPALDDEALADQIRTFLAMIDPETGYIGD